MVLVANFVADRLGPLRDGLYFYSQAALLASILIVAATSSGSRMTFAHPEIWALGLITLVISVGGLLLPWHRLGGRWMIVIAIFNILSIVQLRAELFTSQPGLAILVLIPTLWMSFSFGLAGVILAVISDYLVALFPYLLSGNWPGNPSDWGSATLLPAIVSAVGIAVYIAARQIRKQKAELTQAYERLQEADAQRRDSESTAVTVINSVNAGITVYDRAGQILLTNATARSLATLGGGTSTREVRSSMLVFEQDRVTPIPAHDQVVARAERGELETGRIVWVGAGELQRAVAVTSQLVHRDSGELVGTVVVTQDVTELTNAIEARDDFLRTVSHELRTPLTSMIGYLEVIEDAVDLGAAGIADEFSKIQRNSQRLLALINVLIIEAEGRVSPRRQPEDISTLAHLAVERIAPAAEAAGITITEAQHHSALAEVDQGHISQVFDALLSNAIKFNRRGGAIAVSVTTSMDSVLVRVSDTGIGIPGLEQSKVFDRFYRGSAAHRGVVAGAGLGLSSAKLIVESHNGTISIDGSTEGGTTVEVRLPAAGSQPSIHTTASPDDNPLRQ